LVKHFPQASVTHNIIIGSDAKTYGKDNYYPVSIRQIGFVDYQKGDYRLSANSPYQNRGSGGKPIGANLDPQTVGGKS
jgi:hypothetical protein